MEQQKNDLTPAQYDAVKNDAKRLRILAGAGSGKTRVLTHRIAHQSKALRIEPEHVLCLTFTKKAAEELRSRLKGLGLGSPVTAGTFHALAYAQLQGRWTDLNLSRPPTILENRRRMLGSILPERLAFEVRESIFHEIDWATARRLTPETYPAAAEKAQRNPPSGATQISECLYSFLQEKRKRNLIDFDDILEHAIRDLANDADYAAGRHWKYRYIFVDEFQDVNPLQFALLRAWMGANSSICVVGDPNQAIYSWNGADAKYLENFNEYFPDGQTVELNDNFRSTPQIVAAASSLLGSSSSLDAQRPNGEIPSLHQAKNCSAEAEYIARRINENRPLAGNWAGQAVLVRTHAQINQLVDTFTQFSIPFSVPKNKDWSSEIPISLSGDDSVTLTTFHAAKGLEWPIVYVAGLEAGFSPISHAISPSSLDEERRLLYVAMTRAEDQLHCSWARERTFAGKKVARKPSPYLKEISHSMEAANIQNSDTSPLRDRIKLFREQVFSRTNPERYTTQQRKNLEGWRESMALAADVSPRDVIPDEAVEQLLSQKPQNRGQLKEISDLNDFKAARYGDEIIRILSDENAAKP